MKKHFLAYVALFLLLTGVVNAQDDSLSGNYEQYTLEGQLLDAETSEEIPFAHITNLNLNIRVSSDSEGFFSLSAREGDSLQLSSVTYGKIIMIAPADPAKQNRLVILLSPNVYELEEVVISRFPSEHLLKQQLLGLELPEENKPNMRIPKGYFPQADPSANPSVSLGSPVSAIAGKFSKKQRGREFAAEMKEREARKAVIHTKFNRQIVQEITQLEDEDQLDAFMKYCVLAEDFLFKASEYEIHKAVIGCYKEFAEG